MLEVKFETYSYIFYKLVGSVAVSFPKRENELKKCFICHINIHIFIGLQVTIYEKWVFLYFIN